MRKSSGWSALLHGELHGKSRLTRRLSRGFRKMVTRFADPDVVYEAAGARLVLPLSHQLPVHQHNHPHYDTALFRLARFVRQSAGQLHVIDVGANVGDSTACILVQVPDSRVIAVEGNSIFLPYLHANIADARDRVVVFSEFVGSGKGTSAFTIRTGAGTAMLESAAGDGQQLRSLVALITESRMPSVELIKVDTDGFDIEILRGCLDYCRTARPTIFFEFDPKFFLRQSPDGFNILAEFAAIGYPSGIVYLNTGELIRSIKLEDGGALLEMRTFLASSPLTTYFDIALFPDQALADAFLQAEIEEALAER